MKQLKISYKYQNLTVINDSEQKVNVVAIVNPVTDDESITKNNLKRVNLRESYRLISGEMNSFCEWSDWEIGCFSISRSTAEH